MARNHESIIRQQFPDGVKVLGGMGVDISSKYLAGTVAGLGGAGTLSETGGAIRLARMLQDGDPDGHIHESLVQFPNQNMVDYVYEKYYLPDGKRPMRRAFKYRPVPKYFLENKVVEGLGVAEVEMLTVLDAFEQVVTARRISQGNGILGVNGLGKIPMPMSAALYGAMLAGAEYTVRGAGVRTDVPDVIETLYNGNPVDYEVKVDYAQPGSPHKNAAVHFDPAPYGGQPKSRPEFWAIAGTIGGAQAYLDGGADVIVREDRVAGGHNMPERIKEDPIEAFIALDAPIILAGGVARMGLKRAVELGAAGIQVGSLFAVSRESGMAPAERGKAISLALQDRLEITDDTEVSPTGYPFRTANIPLTAVDPKTDGLMSRECPLSVLHTPFENAHGAVEYRCAADTVEKALPKFRGPKALAKVMGARCLCRVLFASSGKGQINSQTGERDVSLVTLGATAPDDIRDIVAQYGRPITAETVMKYID